MWSFTRARRAAGQVREAPLGRQAMRTVRPRGVSGLLRSRAPLALQLYVAAREGLVVEQDGGGFAVLRHPLVSSPLKAAGHWLRLLRWFDQHWDLTVFAGPPVVGLLFAALPIPGVEIRLARGMVAVAALCWVTVFMLGLDARGLGRLARMGAPSTPRHGRAAESLPGYHWSVPLLHQPDPGRLDVLLQLLTERLVDLIHAAAQEPVRHYARVRRPQVTETLVVLTSGITTTATQAAVAESRRALQDYPTCGDVVVLAAPDRLERVPPRPVPGGGFLLLYLAGLAVVIAAGTQFVAELEAGACRPGSCAGRPATYPAALRWLLQRLLFSDPPGLSPATTRVVELGWLVSALAVMLVVVAFVAGREEIARNRQVHLDYDERIRMTITGRALILVVTPDERDAVLAAVRRRVGHDAVLDNSGERTVYILGSVAGTELWLGQAGEQGTASDAAMFETARTAIEHCRPDYVILTGICFGLRPDEGQQLGDIVIARRVQNIDHRKATGDSSRPVIYRGVNVGCSPGLLDRFQAGQTSWSGARVHIGTVLTSNTLVDSEELVTQLRTDFPDAIAGEMEGHGVHEAATLGTKPDWIMVKAISDWGHRKNNDAQPLAARNAAEFVMQVVAGGALRRRRSGNSP